MPRDADSKRLAGRSADTTRSADLALVQRLLLGEQEAFDSFWSEHAERLYRFARRRAGGDGELAREVVQGALCTAVQTLEQYRGEGSLYSWICGICKFELLARLRKRRRYVHEVEIDAFAGASGVSATLVGAPDGAEAILLREEAGRKVHEVLDALPDHYGRVLEWKYARQLSIREIAQRLGASEKAVESLLSRARRAFRSAFDQGRQEDAVVKAEAVGWKT